MNKTLASIMLIDDDDDDNFFHEREIKKVNPAIIVIMKNSGKEALAYLKSKKDNKDPHPDLIFLDINMPGMNGWEFLEEYYRLDKELQSQAIIMMLTNSQNPNDVTRAKTSGFVHDYIKKPLTKELLLDIMARYFQE